MAARPTVLAGLALVVTGLVEVVPNRGFRVTVVDDRDLDDIRALRLILEIAAIELVVERASDASLNELEARLAELEAAASTGDVPAYLVADRAFHLELLALAGNRRLVRIAAELRDQARLAAAETLEVMAEEHRPILEAIQARDVARAQRIMARHLEHARVR